MHIFATFTNRYFLDKDILALVVLWLRKIQTALYPMQFSTGNRSTVSKSHENDVFPSNNASEVMLCAGSVIGIQTDVKTIIQTKNAYVELRGELMQPPAHIMTSEAFFDVKTSFS